MCNKREQLAIECIDAGGLVCQAWQRVRKDIAYVYESVVVRLFATLCQLLSRSCNSDAPGSPCN